MSNTDTELMYRCLVCEQARSERDVPCEACGAADYLHVVEGEGLVAYTRAQLDTLLGRAAAEIVAARLRERADLHRRQAVELDGLTRLSPLVLARENNAYSGWLRGEADALEWLAARELADTQAGESR